MARLNIGCGNYYLKGWFNIDKDVKVKADDHYDILDGLKDDNDSVKEILLSHVLMYFTKDEVVSVLDECCRVLEERGRLRITEDSPLKKRNAKQQKQYGKGELFWPEEMLDLLGGFKKARITKPFPEVKHHMNLPNDYPLYNGEGAVYFLTAIK